MAQTYEDEDSGIAMSPDPATPKRNEDLLDRNHDDNHEQAEAERRRLFQEQRQRDNRMQQALAAARKRMESGRNTIERMMQEETARTQKMERLEAESERLKSMLSERDMAIAVLTQTVIKERTRFKNERAAFQKSVTATDTETEPAETLYVDDSLNVVSRKRKRGMPTPPRSYIAAPTADNGSNNDDEDTYTFDLNDGSEDDAPLVSSSPSPRRARTVACAAPKVLQPAGVASEPKETSKHSRAPTAIAPSFAGCRIRGNSKRTRARPIPIVRVYNLRPRRPINYKF